MNIQKLWMPFKQHMIQADLYQNSDAQIHKIIIMAHGLGGEKSYGLDEFARHYLTLGYAVCVFDHRGFGESTGPVKNLVDKNSQIQDWSTTIAYLKNNYHLNDQQLVLWGYSFSGAHVLTLASQHAYKAIIANLPHADGLASLTLYPKKYLLPAAILSLQDLSLAPFGKVKSMPVVAKNRFAILAGNDCYQRYNALIPKDTQWDNEVPARIVATIGLYRPTTVVHKIQCPVMLIGATQDSLIPITATRKMAKKNALITYHEHNCGHFDLFHDPFKSDIIKQHTQFLASLD